VLLVSESYECCVGALPDRLPDPLTATEKAQVAAAIRVELWLAVSQGIALPERAIPVPDRMKERTGAVR
jgi:hypothetical protein